MTVRTVSQSLFHPGDLLISLSLRDPAPLHLFLQDFLSLIKRLLLPSGKLRFLIIGQIIDVLAIIRAIPIILGRACDFSIDKNCVKSLAKLGTN